MNTWMARPVAGMALLCAVALSACGGDDDQEIVGTITPARYCDLATQLQQVAIGSGASSGPGAYDGSPAAISQALDQMGATIDELVASAPDEIDGDVEKLVKALRAAAGDETAQLTSPTVTGASARVSAYNEANCVVASGPGGDL